MKITLESRPRLEIGHLRDSGSLAPGKVTRLPDFAVTIAAHAGGVDLTNDGGEVQPIPIISGTRARAVLFLCPDCSARCERLFELNEKFCCFRCHGLTYRVLQSPAPAWSALRLRRRHGLPAILGGPLPPWQKPTHGWRAWREHKAYDRAVVRIRRYEARLLARLARFNVELEAHKDSGDGHER